MIANIVGHFGGEIFDEPSITEPNQVMSISEIINRFSLGMDVPFTQGEYDDEDDFVNDPTREPGFDFLDAHILESELEQRKLLNDEVIDQSEMSNESHDGKARANDGASEPETNSNDKASDLHREPSAPSGNLSSEGAES